MLGPSLVCVGMHSWLLLVLYAGSTNNSPKDVLFEGGAPGDTFTLGKRLCPGGVQHQEEETSVCPVQATLKTLTSAFTISIFSHHLSFLYNKGLSPVNRFVV